MQTGHSIRRLRDAAGLTANAVARRAGLHPTVLCRMETGKLPVNLGSYTRLLGAIAELRAEADAKWQRALAELGVSVPSAAVEATQEAVA